MNCPACGARWQVDDNGEPTPDYNDDEPDAVRDWRVARERWLEAKIDELATSRNDFKLLAAELSNQLYDARRGGDDAA